MQLVGGGDGGGCCAANHYDVLLVIMLQLVVFDTDERGEGEVSLSAVLSSQESPCVCVCKSGSD